MSGWKDLSTEERVEIVSRFYNKHEDIATLAAEVNANPITLKRAMQKMRSQVIKVAAPVQAPSKAKQINKTRKAEYPEILLDACIFDIETMDFGTGGIQSHLVCASILPIKPEATPYTLRLEFKDKRHDQRLLKEVIAELSKYQILIGHNISAYDLNWLYSRCMYYSMTPPPSWLTYDTYQASRRIAIKTESKSLGALGSYFGVEADKTRVFRTDWSFIDSPDKDEFDNAMAFIVEHCESDVTLNKGVFNAVWKYDTARRLGSTKW